VVILLIRVAFAIPNKLRDKKFAEGDQRYDPSGITYEDMTDKQNLHFRYLSKSSCYTPRRVSREPMHVVRTQLAPSSWNCRVNHIDMSLTGSVMKSGKKAETWRLS